MSKINLTVPHSLAQQVAWERLPEVLQSLKSQGGFIPVQLHRIEEHLYHKQFELVAKFEVHAMMIVNTMELTFVVNPKDIHVVSDFANEPFEGTAMQQISGRLKAALEDKMK